MNIVTSELDNITNNLDNIKINKSIDVKQDKRCKKSDNCQELKNIAYKTMLMNGNDINPKYENKDNNIKISNFLENESCANKKETWSKLDKTQKIKHLNIYADLLKTKDNLSEEELSNLKKYFVRCLDRKCLLKTKEVIYDKDNKIMNVPFLFFNEEQRNYILRKDDKHVSTIKSLPVNKNSKAKTIKIHE